MAHLLLIWWRVLWKVIPHPTNVVELWWQLTNDHIKNDVFQTIIPLKRWIMKIQEVLAMCDFLLLIWWRELLHVWQSLDPMFSSGQLSWKPFTSPFFLSHIFSFMSFFLSHLFFLFCVLIFCVFFASFFLHSFLLSRTDPDRPRKTQTEVERPGLLFFPFWRSYFIKSFGGGLQCEFIRTFSP